MVYGQTFLNEGIIGQIFLARKIKPKMDIVDAYKKHSYPGLLNMVKNTDNVNDLKYLLKDSTTASNQRQYYPCASYLGECTAAEAKSDDRGAEGSADIRREGR